MLLNWQVLERCCIPFVWWWSLNHEAWRPFDIKQKDPPTIHCAFHINKACIDWNPYTCLLQLPLFPCIRCNNPFSFSSHLLQQLQKTRVSSSILVRGNWYHLMGDEGGKYRRHFSILEFWYKISHGQYCKWKSKFVGWN